MEVRSRAERAASAENERGLASLDIAQLEAMKGKTVVVGTRQHGGRGGLRSCRLAGF